MYDIRDYQNKKNEDNINFLIDMIIDNIITNLNNNITYKTNFMITGYNNQLNIIVKKIKDKAKEYKININIDLKFIPTSSTNLIINSSKTNNMFLKFMLMEEEFYNQIYNNKIKSFNIKDNKLNNLYILHALQTAFYHAGYNYAEIQINNKTIKIDAINKTKKYIPKVILIDMIKHNNKIEEERKTNLDKNILVK